MKKGGDARGRVAFKKNLSFFKCVTQCDDSDLWCVIKCFSSSSTLIQVNFRRPPPFSCARRCCRRPRRTPQS